MLPNAGRIALVTGGGRGIGRAIALALAEDGADVGINFVRDKGAAQETVKAIEARGRRAVACPAAIEDSAACETLVATVTRELGPVDILVNVAGILSNNKCFETTGEEWRRVHAINYDSALYLAKACLPHMQRTGWGRVVNLSSWAWKSGGRPPTAQPAHRT